MVEQWNEILYNDARWATSSVDNLYYPLYWPIVFPSVIFTMCHSAHRANNCFSGTSSDMNKNGMSMYVTLFRSASSKDFIAQSFGVIAIGK